MRSLHNRFAQVKRCFFLFALLLALTGCGYTPDEASSVSYEAGQGTVEVDGITIPSYDGEPYVELEDNMPDFTDEEKQSTEPFEIYSELDDLGRCQVAYANICKELMPTTKRESIGEVHPSGWHTVKYSSSIIEDKYLYNRCHLIGYQLAGENANEENLITGTRYMNVDGMLPFEDSIDDYVDLTDNHVLYRVTPIFEGDDLVASGVEMEAWSVEDEGEGICFHVYCYNVQPGIEIDYATGESHVAGAEQAEEETRTYVLNTNTMRIHLPDCEHAAEISSKNRREYNGTLSELEAKGYTPCGQCLGAYQ